MLKHLSMTIFYLGIFLIPIWSWAGFGDGYELPKIIFFQRWIELLVFFVIIRLIHNRPDVKIKSKTGIAVLIFFVWSLIASLIGSNVENSIFGSYWRWQGILSLFHFCLFFVVVGFLKPKIKYVATALVFGGLFESVYILSTIWTKTQFDWPIYLYAGRVVGTFGNPNYLGGFLAMCLPMVFYLKNLKFRLIAFTLFILTISYTASRGTIVAIFLSSMVLGIIYRFRNSQKSLIKFVVPTIVASLILAVALVSFDVNINNPYESRQRIYVRGFLGLLRRPLVGYGLENFEQAIKGIDYPVWVNPDVDVLVDKAHNEVLEVLTSTGLIGLVIWLSLVLNVGRDLFKEKRFLLLASFIIFLIKSQTNVVSFPEHFIFWLVVSLSTTGGSQHKSLSEVGQR